MKFVFLLSSLHGLQLSEAKVGIAFASLFALYVLKKLNEYLTHRKLAPLLGQKADDGYKFKIKRSGNRYEIWKCNPSYSLSDIEGKKEILETYLHIKISAIRDEKRGLLFFKKTIFVIYAERKLKNYQYTSNKLKLNRGDWFFGWDLSLAQDVLENTEKGAYSCKVLGSSGTGKSNFVKVILDSLVQACIKNNEPFKIVIADPKTSFLWAKQKYGAVICNPMTFEGAKELHEHLESKYEEIINTSEVLKKHNVHVEHIKDLTPGQIQQTGIKPMTKTIFVFEEYERYWSSDRKAIKPTKESTEAIRTNYEHYLNVEQSGMLTNHLLGISRSYNGIFLFSTQSALLSASDYPNETSIQIVASSRISVEASLRIYGNNRVATASNCATGQFILKSDNHFGNRKVQVPLFKDGGKK